MKALLALVLLASAVAADAATPPKKKRAPAAARAATHSVASPVTRSVARSPLATVEQNGAALPPGVVALTFDDGPHRRHTGEVLELLAAHKAPATFFMLGQQVE